MPKPEGDISPPNNLAVSPPIIWVGSSSASPPIVWFRCASKRRSSLEFEEKSVPFLVKTFFFFFGLHLILGKKKCSVFGEDLFFWSSPELAHMELNLLTWKNRGRGSSPAMSKIGQNWGKIPNYPPQCSTKICTTACNGIAQVRLSLGLLKRSLPTLRCALPIKKKCKHIYIGIVILHCGLFSLKNRLLCRAAPVI